MALRRFALTYASLCLMLSTPLTVRAANTCWVQKATRDGSGVKVDLYVPKGNPPGVAVPMTIIRTNGSRTFINKALLTSTNPVKFVTRNPRTSVIMYVGDELGFAGMDYGCTVKVVRIGGDLELKIEGGLPRVPGIDNHYVSFMPVAAKK